MILQKWSIRKLNKTAAVKAGEWGSIRPIPGFCLWYCNTITNPNDFIISISIL